MVQLGVDAGEVAALLERLEQSAGRQPAGEARERAGRGPSDTIPRGLREHDLAHVGGRSSVRGWRAPACAGASVDRG